MTLEDVAGELYGLGPAEFIAARAARAGAAERAGDKKLAAAISKLRKPTLSAWAANLLARAAPEEVGALLRLGAALAAAQRELSADRLRDLTAQRQQVVDALAKKAGALAAEHGHPVGEGVLREVGQTLTAALADPEVAESVRTGTLTTAASYAGFGPGGLEAVAAPGPGTDESPERAGTADRGRDSLRRAKGGRTGSDHAAADRAEADRAELAAALTALDSARRAAVSAESELTEARNRLSDCESRIAALEDELTRADAERTLGRAAERTAKDRLRIARHDLERAEREAARTRERFGDG